MRHSGVDCHIMIYFLTDGRIKNMIYRKYDMNEQHGVSHSGFDRWSDHNQPPVNEDALSVGLSPFNKRIKKMH